MLGRVITRKAIHYLPIAVGMFALAAGIAVFRIEVPSSQALTLVGSALTGFGLGATVAPALFVAGFSLPSANLQRVFAIVELMRAVAAFMIAPIFIHYALTVGGSLDAGTASALWIGLALAIVGLLFGVAIYALSGARPRSPTLTGSWPASFPPGIHRRCSEPSVPASSPRRRRPSPRPPRRWPTVSFPRRRPRLPAPPQRRWPVPDRLRRLGPGEARH